MWYFSAIFLMTLMHWAFLHHAWFFNCMFFNQSLLAWDALSFSEASCLLCYWAIFATVCCFVYREQPCISLFSLERFVRLSHSQPLGCGTHAYTHTRIHVHTCMQIHSLQYPVVKGRSKARHIAQTWWTLSFSNDTFATEFIWHLKHWLYMDNGLYFMFKHVGKYTFISIHACFNVFFYLVIFFFFFSENHIYLHL